MVYRAASPLLRTHPAATLYSESVRPVLCTRPSRTAVSFEVRIVHAGRRSCACVRIHRTAPPLRVSAASSVGTLSFVCHIYLRARAAPPKYARVDAGLYLVPHDARRWRHDMAKDPVAPTFKSRPARSHRLKRCRRVLQVASCLSLRPSPSLWSRKCGAWADFYFYFKFRDHKAVLGVGVKPLAMNEGL